MSSGGAPETVWIAAELRELSGESPEWPEGRATRFLGRDTPVPEDPAAAALIVLPSRPVGERDLARLPGLRIVANYAVGYDNIDVEAAAARGIVVTNTPDVLTDATADLAWALLLGAARRVREGLALAIGGKWTGWHPRQLLGLGLQGKVLGILGAGRIGTAVARRAPGFGMEVAYWSRSPAPALEREVGALRMDSLDRLLESADVVSIHLPLTEATHGLIGRDELAHMRPGSILVNTARGPIVDTEALSEALRSGPLAAAGIDVYPDEPRIPEALRELPNALVLPHLGSATREARRGMWELAAENVRRVLGGAEPVTPVVR